MVGWLVILFGCSQPDETATQLDPQVDSPQIERDLNHIREDGLLKAITVYSETSYFIYRGRPMGFEYELLKRLADRLGVRLEIVEAQNLDEMVSMLNRGEGDLIAHGLTVTKSRKAFVDFTKYLYLTQQVLVQRKPNDWRQKKLHEIQKDLIRDPIELIGDTVSVRVASSYYERLQNLEEEVGGDIYIDTIPGTFSTGRIIKQVVEGNIDYTVADENIAKINSAYYPSLHVETPVSFSQRTAWAVRQNAPQLQTAINEWIAEMQEEVDYYVIYNRYFENKRSFRARVESEFYSRETGKISPYDPLIKKYASNLGWDWRFVSSIVYQESQFDPRARSWAHARGLMQLMPATARELGVRDRTDPEQNLRAGTTYLAELWDRWSNIPDSTQRLKFTLASYNCGYHHVLDAQRLTEKYGGDPLQWDGQVAAYVRKLSYPKYYKDEAVDYGYVRGIEPVTYVRQIFERYEHYKRVMPLEREA